MPTKAKRLKSLAISLILIISLFAASTPSYIPEVEAASVIGDPEINLKEHDIYAGAANSWYRFINFSGTYLRLASAQNAFSRGKAYMVIMVKPAVINGGSLLVSWQGTGGVLTTSSIYIKDGSYDRTLNADFPIGQNSPTNKGLGTVQAIVTNRTHAFAAVYETFALSFASSQTWVTLFIEDWDNDGVGFSNTYIYNITLLSSSGATVFETNFDGILRCDDGAAEETAGCGQFAAPEGSSGWIEETTVLSTCIPVDFEIMNPSALAEDGTPWVFTETKFYWFNATYANFNLTGDEASIRFSPDGDTNVTVTYDWLNDINGVLSVVDAPDFITVPSVARNGTGAYYNSTTDDFWVIFPIWFTDNSPDAQNVDVYYACTGSGYYDSGYDFHIYNQGGLIERVTPPINTTFTTGGDWFEMCGNTTLDTSPVISVNQTWRKLQHYQVEYALHFYHKDGTPEDQFMQDSLHLGAPPETVWGAAGDWLLVFRIYGYDNSSSNWVRLIYVSMQMEEGDEGANDEWIRIRSTIGDRTGAVIDDYWNAFIEEEPAARFRTWLDIWVNKINASSVIGARTNAYYFGMDDSGYLFWANWSPMVDNSTELIGFTDILDANNNVTQARDYDLMKIEVELSMGNAGASHNYTVCLEEVNINEVQLASQGELLSGVNTPIFIAPKVPDMPIGGILAPLYAAITSLGDTLWSALTGLADIAWAALASQFPWFTGAWESFMGLLESITTLATTIIGYLIDFFTFAVDYIGFLATPINVITDSWGYIVDATEAFWSVNPSGWMTLLIVVFGIVPVVVALEQGNYGYVGSVFNLVWGVARTLIDFFMRIIRLVVDVLAWVWPF